MAMHYARHDKPHAAADPPTDVLALLREALMDVELIARRFEDTASHSAGTLYGAADAIRAARELIAAEPPVEPIRLSLCAACGHVEGRHFVTARACLEIGCACAGFVRDAADAARGSGVGR